MIIVQFEKVSSWRKLTQLRVPRRIISELQGPAERTVGVADC